VTLRPLPPTQRQPEEEQQRINRNLLSSGYTSISDLSAGETWNFEIDFRGYTANAIETAIDYEIFLTVS
jgi:phosphoribosylformylglycinamidine (FGAM) synthase PurS component